MVDMTAGSSITMTRAENIMFAQSEPSPVLPQFGATFGMRRLDVRIVQHMADQLNFSCSDSDGAQALPKVQNGQL